MTSKCLFSAKGEKKSQHSFKQAVTSFSCHSKKICQLHVHQYNILMDFKHLSVVLTDAFMDFTSGILSVTGINATGHIFASYPARHLSVLGGFIDQVSSGHCDPMTSPSIAHRRSHSGSKYWEVWQMQLMHHWLSQLVWEHPLVCSVLGPMTNFLAFTGRSNLYLTPFSTVFFVRAVIQNNVH